MSVAAVIQALDAADWDTRTVLMNADRDSAREVAEAAIHWRDLTLAPGGETPLLELAVADLSTATEADLLDVARWWITAYASYAELLETNPDDIDEFVLQQLFDAIEFGARNPPGPKIARSLARRLFA